MNGKMLDMRKSTLLVSALIALTGLKLPATPASAAEEATKAQKAGYAVTVEFYVDSGGAVTKAKVADSELEELNDFALQLVEAGQLLPHPLPPHGSPPKHIRAPVFFPVESYDSGKPLPVGVAMPVPRLQAAPAYPFEYRIRYITGGAWLSVTIGEDGRVKSCKTIKWSHPKFASAAEKAVDQWQFGPATLNGKPVEVTLNVALSFEIEGKPHGWHWVAAPAPSLKAFQVITSAP